MSTLSGGDQIMKSPGGDPVQIAARSSLVDSLLGCGLCSIRIDKEELRRRIVMPTHVRRCMREAIKSKDAAAFRGLVATGPVSEAPEAPMVVFINSRSGGRHGSVLKGRLEELMSEEQVFDLKDVRPSDFVRFGLSCLENMAELGDQCARDIRQKLRIMVAGGDGTVGWVLGSLKELCEQGREPIPPTGIIPLGTGNDLSRSYGWGGSFPFFWRSAVKRSLHKAVIGPIRRLDSWHAVVSMAAGEDVHLPHSMKYMDDCLFSQDGERGGLPEKIKRIEGTFYNYFSIGMDAQVAYGFHHLRNERPYLAHGPIANKIIYSGYSCTQGWFCTPCMSDPSLRGLDNILRLHIKKVNCSDWEQIVFPSSVRALVALNLHNYGSGRNPWGKPKPGYMEKRGYVEAHADDGLLEIFGLKQGWHASFVMVELITAKHIAQAAAIRLEIIGGQRKNAYMQMDGEPWKQPISREYLTFLEIKKVPGQSVMISGE